MPQSADGDIYDFHGKLLDATGVYVDTLTSGNGCDSIVTLTLDVLPEFETPVSASICEGDTYDFHGTLLDASGVYVDTLTAGNGCDSIVTLTLDVLPEFATPVSASICEGDTYDFHGTLLDASGVYVDTLTAGNGCDSIVTLTLDVLPEFETPVSASICEGDTYDFHGTLLDATGVYVDTLSAGNGCDSIVTLTLDVLPEFATPVSASICEGDSYDFHGTLLDATGVYVDTLSAGNGCDSIVTLTLDVLPEFETPVSASICEGDSYDFHGTLLDATGVYVDTLSAGNGCDSIVTLTLDVLPEFETPVSASICEGDSYNFHGTLLDTTGVYVDTLTAGNGCDSIVTLTLEVLPEFETPVSASICERDSYNFHGTLLDTTGVYVDTLTAGNGCDSIVTLTLDVLPEFETPVSASICEGDTYDFHGTLLDATGVYVDTLTAGNGCDSIVTLTLDVLPEFATPVSASICEGETYDFHGTPLDTTGVYVDTLTSGNGCDSIVTLTLDVLPEFATPLSASICEGDTYDFHGTLLDATGIYVDTLTSGNGCDSIVTLTLGCITRICNSCERFDLRRGNLRFPRNAAWYHGRVCGYAHLRQRLRQCRYTDAGCTARICNSCERFDLRRGNLRFPRYAP